MQTVDLILNARWIVPIASDDHDNEVLDHQVLDHQVLDHQVLDHHSLVINQGRISAILPTTQVSSRYQSENQHDYLNHVLMPGLVNAHTHAAMTLMRGMADDLPLLEWLNEHIWPTEGRWVDADYVRDGSELAMAEMLRGGITCFNDMYFFPEVVAEAARSCGMRAVLGLIVIDFPSAWAQNADEYLSKGLTLHDSIKDDSTLHCAFAPHAPYTVSGDTLQRVRDLAVERSLPIHIHVHETAAEVAQCVEQHGQRPLAYLDQLGLLSPRLVAVHMTQLTDKEINRVADSGMHVLHCPESNLKLASGFCPTAQLINAGINVAIGTDGAASNNDLDMFSELRTAALLAKAVAADASALPAHQVLQMATLNGARALGLADEIGSLAPGKQADVIAVDLAVLESQPTYNPISQLVYATGRQQVSDVWVAGRQLLQNRQLTTLNSEQLVERARHWQQKISN